MQYWDNMYENKRQASILTCNYGVLEISVRCDCSSLHYVLSYENRTSAIKLEIRNKVTNRDTFAILNPTKGIRCMLCHDFILNVEEIMEIGSVYKLDGAGDKVMDLLESKGFQKGPHFWL